ncbi:MAG: YifB family Mg chelatase-like AAA ATPase [Hungatella sp.]|nr:YifB family Mg chelatase-like AAA ATPase [Hungatella sp.]
MFYNVCSIGLFGMEGSLVHVEVDSSDGLPSFIMVGALAPEVREAQDRVRTALKNSGFRFPPRKVTINLSPADIRKNGTGFDLAIVAGVLGANQILGCEPKLLEDSVFLGELGLDGRVKGVRGILPMVMKARECNKSVCYLPWDNVREGNMIPEVRIVGVRHIKDLADMIRDREGCREKETFTQKLSSWTIPAPISMPDTYDVDYEEVQGQFLMKRATEVAVAGRHNLLYIGPAGTGKTMIAERIPTIMPSCTQQEQLEISKTYSICGLLPREHPLMIRRPFCHPHHSVTAQALTGGGKNPVPGEMSLASKGVLFLDELPEFSRQAIEVMRQPLENHKVILSRVHGRYEFPADFMLVAAMNPCPCGHYPDRNKCNCSEEQVRKYLKKVSKPILDRLDICVEAAPVAFEELRGTIKQEPSSKIRERVEKVREIQKKRFEGSSVQFNSEMGTEMIEEFCSLTEEDEHFFKEIYQRKEFSARAYAKILKVARTVADLDESENIMHKHLCEAIGYRSLEEKYWNRTR